MKISKLTIRNYRRVQDLDLDIRRHAVIVGANDVGKSSILRLLDMALGASIGSLYQNLSPADLREHSEPLIVEATWVDFTDSDRALFPDEISIDGVGNAESLKMQTSVSISPEDRESIAIRRWFPESGHERQPSREQLNAFGWRYLTANRNLSLVDGPASPMQTLLQSAELGEHKQILKQLLDQYNQGLDGNESVKDLLARVARQLAAAMPREIRQNDLKIRSIADPEKNVLGNVSMFFVRDAEQVSMRDQSDGVRQLIAMAMFDLAEGAANVIAIDEPELHLHPSSQRTAAVMLSGSGSQKFLATHSPYVVQRFEPKEIIAIDRHGYARQITESDYSKVEKVAANWWSSQLLEALTARFVVVVEGLSDRIIVEAAARVMGVDLDRIGAVVLALDGADKFKNVFPLIGPGGFGPDLLGLVDKNESQSWINIYHQKPRNVVDVKIFVSEPDLEGEYSYALGGEGVSRSLIDGGHCDEKAILQSAGASALADVTPEAAAAFCRKSKVSAAACVADTLTADAAKKLASIDRLLTRLRTVADS